ncbi:MAG: DUF2332 domain-containing protein [Planctomycetota bacterium]|jgi:hypothetical protein
MADRSEISAAFARQSEICAAFGSPLYSRLLSCIAADLQAGGASAGLLAEWEGPALRAALPLRLMGAVHRLVLQGQAEALAAFYAGAGSADEAWPSFRTLLQERGAELLASIAKPPQTNEVGRSAAFLVGMLAAAGEYGLPLALAEIGCSAGLNLFWDRYRYELGDWRWGEERSPVCIRARADGSRSGEGSAPQVHSRRGCDLHPIDLQDAAARLDLESYVWADQPARLATLRAAIELVRGEGLQVEASPAPEWVADRLAEESSGVTTVLYHSVMWAYMSDEEQVSIEASLSSAGRARDRDAPLVWLSLEDAVDRYAAAPELRLRYRSWPSGEDRILAHANPHGSWLRWPET